MTTDMHPTSAHPRTGTIGRYVVAALAAAASLVGSALLAAPAVAAEAPAWEISTADGVMGSGRQNFYYAAQPGDRIEDALHIVNHDDSPLDLALYAADAFTTDAGELDLRTEDHEATSVGRWVGMQEDHVSLQPGESTEIPFTIAVPTDATDGDHLGGIVTSLDAEGSGPEVRSAIRVQLRVGNGFAPSLAVEDLAVQYGGDPVGTGDATVTYTLRNTGDTTLAAEQSVTLTGPFGAFPATGQPIGNVPRLLPGETWSVSAPVPGVIPSGVITADVTVVPLYTDSAGSTGPLGTVNRSVQGFAIPWVPLLLLLGLAALVVLLLRAAIKRGLLAPRDRARR